MATTKYAVDAIIGTVKRASKSRTYTHVVVARGERAEVLEAARIASINYDRKMAHNYRTGKDTFGKPLTYFGYTRPEVMQWADEAEQRANALEASGLILSDNDVRTVLGWTSRLDLARKLASDKHAARFRTVRIYDVATGQEVR